MESALTMLTITAVIRAKKGDEETMRRALLAVAENVRLNEPNTIGFFVSQDPANPASSPPMSGFSIRPRWTPTIIRKSWRASSVSPSPFSTAMSCWSRAPRFQRNPDPGATAGNSKTAPPRRMRRLAVKWPPFPPDVWAGPAVAPAQKTGAGWGHRDDRQNIQSLTL